MDSTLVNVLIGSGACGVFCLLFVLGLIVPKNVYDDLREENAQLKAERKAERDRADAAIAAVEASKNVLAAFQAGRALAGGPQP